jgi:hypothetical protein
MSARDNQSRAPSIEAVNMGENPPAVPRLCPDTSNSEPSAERDSVSVVAGGPMPSVERRGAGRDHHAGHDARGRFVAGNLEAYRHGGRSARVAHALLPEQRDRFETLANRRAAILSDLGGADVVSVIKADLLDRYLEVSTVAAWLGGHLIADGPLTAKGHARAATTLFLQVVDRLHRLGATLGARHHTRSSPRSCDSAVATEKAQNKTSRKRKRMSRELREAALLLAATTTSRSSVSLPKRDRSA